MGVYILIIFIVLVAALIVAFAALTIALFASIRSTRKSGAPFFPTPKRTIRDALRAAKLKPGETFYDLGAGTGVALRIAEKEFGAHAVGFEISPIFYVAAKINLFLRHAHSKIKNADFFNQDIGEADVIFCFLAIRTMQKMEKQILRQAKPGARIIVYAFPLPGMQSYQTIFVHGQWKIHLYRMPAK